MNQRAFTPGPRRPPRAWFIMPLLLSALAAEVAQSTAPPMNAEEGSYLGDCRDTFQPYLRYIGPPPLRFQEPVPPPDVSARPPPAGPPASGGKTKPEIVHAPVQDVPVMAPPASPTPPIVAGPPPRLPPRMRELPPADSSTPTGPAPLLPDDGRARVKPEDFLPFFQFPGKGPPPSSATYQQQ